MEWAAKDLNAQVVRVSWTCYNILTYLKFDLSNAKVKSVVLGVEDEEHMTLKFKNSEYITAISGNYQDYITEVVIKTNLRSYSLCGQSG